ncbi:MAG: MMPL family transporter [Myxococcales bacterium]|nr:MMPL family transporter [Myxococcales bacterium]
MRMELSLRGVWSRLVDAQISHPLRIVCAAFTMGLLAIPLVLELSLNGDFTALLPENKPSVQDLNEIQERFGRQATLTIAVEANTNTIARAAVYEFAQRLATHPLASISSVDWNVSEFTQFVEKHRHLYANLEDLEEVRDVLSDRLSYELGRANPLYVDLSDDDGVPPDPAAVMNRLDAKAAEARDKVAQFPGGYFEHPELPLVVFFVRTTIKGGETAEVDRLLSALRAESAELEESHVKDGLHVFFGGELMDIHEEQQALTQAVIWATVITVVMVLVILYVFFGQVLALIVLGLSMVPPLLITFAVAELTVDYLNASSAFLSSIVLGNGINPNIIWLARYFELRRQGKGQMAALQETHWLTWAATLTASTAAGLAYVSLVMTDFRGFRDFGIIGGVGMVLCWLTAYTLLPSLVVVFERLRPQALVDQEHGSSAEIRGFSYGRFFSGLIAKSPRLTVLVSMLLAAVSLVVVGFAIRSNPMEYDFRNLQSRRPVGSRTQWVNDRQSEIVDETTTGSAIAILVPSVADVPFVTNQLDRYRSETSSTAFGAVRTVWDLLPEEQEDKLEILEEIQEIVPKLAKHAEAEDKKRLEDNRLPDELKTLTPKDLPGSIAQYFAETDGTLGKIIFVEHYPGRNNWDGKYLVEWADAVRSVRLLNGERPAIAGQPPVFADLLQAIWVDGPLAVGAALTATIFLLVLTFRRWGERLFTLGTLLLGILWMGAFMALGGIKLNFLNFVAFPITFGNGVDYGVNVMRRYVDERRRYGENRWAAIQAAVDGTGGAVVLCSLTTIIGYISLYTSTNSALNSFGAAMAISEVTCVCAGVLTLPALLLLKAGR